MSQLGPRVELRRLKAFVAEVENRFIAKYLGVQSLTPPSREEELDAAAYVVLVHGGFENFVEGLSLWLAGRIERSWVYQRRATRCTASLLLYHPMPRDDAETSLSVFDNIRRSVMAGRASVSQAIADNNGVAPAHLRRLFRPLGIDVPSDPGLTASLDRLVAMRHAWAHQYRFGARVSRSATDAKVVSDDCLTFAARLAVGARRARA
jgi:hypothetical protein